MLTSAPLEYPLIIRIRLFAHMAAHAGASAVTLEMPADCRLSDIPAALRQQFPDLPWPAGTMLAVNQEYAPAAHPLKPNDEVAIIPPVSGG